MAHSWRMLILVLALVSASSGLSRSRAQSASLDLKEHMSVAEFQRCGLHKLTPSELSALGAWIARQAGTSTPRSLVDIPSDRNRGSSTAGDEMVQFNTSSLKYHCASCRWALRCTRNCISIPLSEARRRGVSCSSCGGSCR